MELFPHKDPIDLEQLLDLDEELELSAREVVGLLAGQLTDSRKERIDEVIRERTCTVVPVMDGLHDLGNAAAVMRTAEGLGFQLAHVVETQPEYKMSRRVTQGADKWLDIWRWKDPGRCAKHLRQRGYRIVATDLNAECRLEEVDFTEPVALVFGNEQDGVSEEMLGAADARCILPMSGFVQSYNISVAAAISLYEARRQRVERLGKQGDLNRDEQRVLRAHYYLRSANRPRRLVPRLWKRSK